LKKFLVKRFYDILGFFLAFLGLSFTSRQCKNFLKQNSDKSFDVIIVPGIPFNGRKWDMIMKGRIYWAKYLFDNGIAKNIIFSGAAVHSKWVESKIMALYAEAIGIPSACIFTEEKAEHSTENVFFSYQQALQMEFSSIALASDPFQSKLLRKYISKCVSEKIILLPIVYNILRKMDNQMTDPDIDDSKAMMENFIPLKEREAFSQRFKGTRGKNIISTN
jgi:hypothetical protein